jgi:hypothetical protein
MDAFRSAYPRSDAEMPTAADSLTVPDSRASEPRKRGRGARMRRYVVTIEAAGTEEQRASAREKVVALLHQLANARRP